MGWFDEQIKQRKKNDEDKIEQTPQDKMIK